jgi:para-aminobenzoate synthetase component I
MTISDFETILNNWGHQRVPFLFLVDFEMQNPFVIKLDHVDPETILFDINGFSNAGRPASNKVDTSIVKKPISFEEYNTKFESVYARLERGDSYLTNLTVKTEIELRASLRDLFFESKARYKLFFNDQFLVFSPEIFIQIRDDKIFSYPMKGTIDKSVPDAEKVILHNTKEIAEHVTIVDLIRNDISQIADNVQVNRFRYIEEIHTNQQDLFQVSSEIVGTIHEPFSKIGTLLVKLLPAGSVSGAPKPKTLEIIRQAEQEHRGYYTGIMGIFDGYTLDSGVIIRFIEKSNGRHYYRSGGGITAQSDSEAEFKEVLDKIYVPVS